MAAFQTRLEQLDQSLGRTVLRHPQLAGGVGIGQIELVAAVAQHLAVRLGLRVAGEIDAVDPDLDAATDHLVAVFPQG